jgi:acyl carrier protein
MSQKIKKFIINYLRNNGKLGKNNILDDTDYIDQGYLDSMGIIKFIISIEQSFNIEISENDMISPKFRTINGLTQIIFDKL